MSDNKKDFIVGGKKKKLPTKLVSLVIGVFGSAALIYVTYNLVWDNSFQNSGGQETVEVREKNTAYQGDGVNQNDQAAAEAYCEDTKERINIQGSSRIIDTCVAKSVSSEWLSSMTGDEIEKMYTEQPSCIETGYDDEGYSCFTGYNQAGCDRGGQKEDGTLCEGYAQNDPVNILSGLNTGDVCGLVASCQAESEFDPQGFNKFGCDRQGKNRSGEQCPYEHITRLYNGDGKDQLGFFKDGFTDADCDIRGYNRQGEACAMENVTLVYGIDKRDQYGFFEDGYNDKNCDINGLNRTGEPCDFADVTRVMDPATGLDQFGLDIDGYNSKDCHISGFNRSGEICDEKKITRIIGKSGKDQRGIFGSGYNEFGCSASGVKKDSSMCSTDEVPNVFNPISGKNALGFFNSGFNDSGCSASGFDSSGNLCSLDEITRVFDLKTKIDQLGLYSDGFNEYNCGLDGYDRTGELCSIENMPLVVNPNIGLNQFGLDKGMFAKNGCSITGLNRVGERCSFKDIPRLFKNSFDQFGIGRTGFNAANCNLDGLDRDGSVCALEDMPRIFDPVTGADQFGILPDGYTHEGCNLQGKRRDGTLCSLEQTPRIFSKNGFDQNNIDKNGSAHPTSPNYDALVKNRRVSAGLDTTNLDLDAMKALGFIDGKYNAAGCDINGLNKQGEHCAFEDITGFFDKETGRDQFGLDHRGFNVFNCNLEGLRPDGSKCPDTQVTRIYNADNVDQLGVSATDSPIAKAISKARGISSLLSAEAKKALGLDEEGYFLKTGCNISGLKRDGTLCDYEDIPKVINPLTGRDQFGLDSRGFNQFQCDVYGKKADGSDCKPEETTELMDVFGNNQIGDAVSGLPAANALYSGSAADEIKGIAESNAKLSSDNIKNEDGYDQFYPPLIASNLSNIANPDALEFLTAEIIAELGLDKNLRNAKGCGIDGLRADGSICSLEDTPRIFDPETGLDQFGLTRDNRNIWGCDLEGFDRSGNRCDENKITRIFGSNGFDQRGVNESGFTEFGLTLGGRNIFGCDVEGLKEDGTECESWEKISTFGVDGYDNNNQNRAGEDRFKLINGRNSFGCDVNGLREDGTICPLEEITRLFKKDGTDQFGLRRNNRNEFGCGLDGKREDGALCALENIPRIFGADGVDQLGLTAEGYTDTLCSIDGLSPDGSICPLNEIPRLMGDDGYDQFGIAEDGFNAKNCNLMGLNRQGERCPLADIPMIFGGNGLSQLGITRGGFAEKGCSITGVNRQGERCDIEDIPRFYDAKGADQFGIFADSYNAQDCDINGFGRDGRLCLQSDVSRILVDGVDQLGFGDKGFSHETGCNLENKDTFGKSCHPKFAVKIIDANGVDQFGLVDGFNQYGCDLEGRKTDGSLCDIKDVTNVVGETTGLNQFGIDLETGLAKNGCGLDGRNADGALCDPEDIPRVTDVNGVDQLRLDDEGFSVESGCNLIGFDKEGNQCSPEEIPFVLGDNGLSHLGVDVTGKSPDGYNALGLDVQGCDRNNMTPNGKHCGRYLDLNIDATDTIEIARLLKLQQSSYQQYAALTNNDIGEGSVNISDITYPKYGSSNSFGSATVTNSAALIPVSQAQLEGEQDGGSNGIIEIPEGTTMHVYVETPVNTDYTTTIWGEIIGGELDGAKVRGTIVVPYINDPVMPRDKFKYVFNTMIKDRTSYKIEAVSMTFEDLGEFVEADNVDYHRLQRYGGLLTAAAFQALGATYLDSAEERALTQQTQLTQQATQTLLGQNTRANAEESLSIATDQIADLAKQNFFRRPTIEKGATDLMIIFMAPIDNDELPVVYMDVR